MIIKLFVDWRGEEILTEVEYEERVREMAEDFRTSDYNFSEFLEEHYTYREVWEANEEQRAKIMEQWVDKCLDSARDELSFDEVELEV